MTGATGFIGRGLCQRLADEGHKVLALSRSGGALADGSPSLAMDLAGELPSQAQLRDMDAIFHLAGIAHQHAAASLYHELNELATIALARRCAEAGVQRFVFVSSVKAMGPPTGPEPRLEADCNQPTDAYGQSKWRAEQALRQEFATSAMTVIILRPALVYGPQPRGNLALLARGVKAGLPRPPALGARSMIALDDLLELLLLLASQPLTGVHTWIAADGQCYSTRMVYDLMRAALGMGQGRAWLPRLGWRLAAGLLDLRSGDGPASTYERLFGTELYSAAALMEATGWRPNSSMQDAVMTMVGE